jgi:GNAT superfamily N-acetyltransferase
MEKSLRFIIRAAAVSDVPLLLRFSREFAEYERQPDAVVIKEETLIRDGFGFQPKFRSLIAEWDGEATGYALFFGFYSSLKGSGIFLEDLFVREALRGRGIGRALLCQVARIARQEGCYGIRCSPTDNCPEIHLHVTSGGQSRHLVRKSTTDGMGVFGTYLVSISRSSTLTQEHRLIVAPRIN